MKTRVRRVLAFVLSFAMVAALGLNMTATQSQAAKKKVVKSLSLNKKSVSVKAGASTNVTAKIKVAKGASKKIKAVSSNKKIAAVKVKGTKITVTGKSAGSTKVKVTTVGKNKKGKKISKTLKVNVTDNVQPVVTAAPTAAPVVTAAPVIAPTTVTLNKTNVTMVQGESVKLIANVTPLTQAVTWSSSNTSVATVDNAGNVNGLQVGTANITAAAGTATAVCKVTVSEKKYTVSTIGAVNTQDGTIVVTLTETANEAILEGTTITLSNGGSTITAVFDSVDEKNVVYKIKDSDLSALQNGSYTVASDNMTIDSSKASTTARVDITGSSIKGLVYSKDNYGDVYRVSNAEVNIDGAKIYSDSDGYYQKAVGTKKFIATVKAKGFFDEEREVLIGTNKASAYNFGMELYNQEKVYIYGKVNDSEVTSTALEGAVVTLYEIKNGKERVKAETVTDVNGNYVFANRNADYDSIDVKDGSFIRFAYKQGLDSDCEYRIEISKGISSENLFNVYDMYKFDAFELGSVRAIDKSASMTKVKAVKEMTMQLNWDADKELSSKGDFDVTLLDTDGRTVLANKTLTIEDSYFKNSSRQAMNKVYQLVNAKFFSDSANVMPTIPAGKYYLVVKTMDADGAYIDSTVVCPVEVTPGTVAAAQTATVTSEVTKDITYQVGFSYAYGKTAKSNQKDTLYTVSKSDGTLGSAPVNFDSAVFQVVDGVKVLINNDISNQKLTLKDDIYIATYKQTGLADKTDYYVETAKTHIVDGDSAFSTKEQKLWNVQFTAAANVTSVKFSDVTNFIDKMNTNNETSISDSIYVDSIVIHVDPANDDLSEVTKTIPIETSYTVSRLAGAGIPISDEDAKGLPVGKYDVKVNFADYEMVAEYEDKDETVIDLQDAALVCEAKYERVYPTTISGVISYEDTTKSVSTNGVAVLYSADCKKILAAGRFATSGTQTVYELKDGENGTFKGGSYKLLIRGQGIDYKMIDVTVKDNEVLQNVDFSGLSVGGAIYMNPTVKTTTGSGLDSSASVVAYDEYYINPLDDAVDYNAYWVLVNSNYNGAFALARTDGSETSWYAKDMSEGNYDIEVNSDITDEKVFPITAKETVKDTLEVAYTTYDDYVLVKLSLTNKGTSGDSTDLAFTAGQLDYIVAESEDGQKYKDGYIIRTASSQTAYVFVPKGKFKITVYSDANTVQTTTGTAQYNEEENVDVAVRPCTLS